MWICIYFCVYVWFQRIFQFNFLFKITLKTFFFFFFSVLFLNPDWWLMVSPLECSNEREDAMNHQSDSFLFLFFFIFRNKYFHCLSIPLFGMFCIIHVTHVAALFSIILNIMYIILHIQWNIVLIDVLFYYILCSYHALSTSR